MYVLIKQNSEQDVESVRLIDDGQHGESRAIEMADDMIREELARWNVEDDVTFEPCDGREDERLVGMWAIDDAVWQMWKVG